MSMLWLVSCFACNFHAGSPLFHVKHERVFGVCFYVYRYVFCKTYFYLACLGWVFGST